MITEALLNKLALIRAIDIDVLGMVTANKQRMAEGKSVAYNDKNFFSMAAELRRIASTQAISGKESE